MLKIKVTKASDFTFCFVEEFESLEKCIDELSDLNNGCFRGRYKGKTEFLVEKRSHPNDNFDYSVMICDDYID